MSASKSRPGSSITGCLDAPFFTDVYLPSGCGIASRWSDLLRAAKDPWVSEAGWQSLRRVCARGVADIRHRDRLLSRIDALVSVPSRTSRFQNRRMSLPDEFARTLHDSLGIHYESDALLALVD